MWFFWVYVLFGTQEKTMWCKIFTTFWFCVFFYTFRGPILVKIWWKFSCKKNSEPLFWPKSKIYFIQNKGNGIAHILYESVFWFRKNSGPEVFFTKKKKSGLSAKIGCSGIFSSKIMTEVNDEQGSKYWFSWSFKVVLQYSGAFFGMPILWGLKFLSYAFKNPEK